MDSLIRWKKQDSIRLTKAINRFNREIKKQDKYQEKDIKNLYDVFDGLSLKVEKVEEITGAEVVSFRFNLADGTNYELIYGGHGVKNGSLKSATGGFEYSTIADILAYWSNLNKELEAVSVEESELPKY